MHAIHVTELFHSLIIWKLTWRAMLKSCNLHVNFAKHLFRVSQASRHMKRSILVRCITTACNVTQALKVDMNKFIIIEVNTRCWNVRLGDATLDFSHYPLSQSTSKLIDPLQKDFQISEPLQLPCLCSWKYTQMWHLFSQCCNLQTAGTASNHSHKRKSVISARCPSIIMIIATRESRSWQKAMWQMFKGFQ